MRLKFTKTALDQIPCPTDGRTTVHDTATPGLCVRITRSDVRTFYVCRWNAGKVKWVRLGPLSRDALDGGLTVERARSLVKEVNSRLMAGEDPNAEKRAKRDAATLGVLWDHYLATYAQPHKKASSVGEDRRNYRKHIEPWGAHRHLYAITQADIKLLHTRIGEKSGKYAANRVLFLLSAMFNKTGKDLGFDPRDNPARGVPRFQEKERDRVLYADELQRFMAAVEQDESQDARDFLLVALYTGARRSNILAMRWEDIELPGKSWKIPGESTKNGDPLTVALAQQVLDILNSRAKASRFVFPAKLVTPDQVSQARALAKEHKTTRDIARLLDLSQTQVCRVLKAEFTPETERPMSAPRKAWMRILKVADIQERTTIHDLRRTFATWMLRSGASLPVIAAAIGHKDIRTTQKVYSWADFDLVRNATVNGANAIDEAIVSERTVSRSA